MVRRLCGIIFMNQTLPLSEVLKSTGDWIPLAQRRHRKVIILFVFKEFDIWYILAQ